jgi:hypothetical protein
MAVIEVTICFHIYIQLEEAGEFGLFIFTKIKEIFLEQYSRQALRIFPRQGEGVFPATQR